MSDFKGDTANQNQGSGQSLFFFFISKWQPGLQRMEWEEAFHALSVTQWLLATKAMFLIEVMPWMITRELKGGVTIGAGGSLTWLM